MRPGVAFYFQHVNSYGKKRLLPMGSFDVDGKHGRSLMAARGKAAGLSQLYRGGAKDLHEYLERRDLEEEVARTEAQEAADRERNAAFLHRMHAAPIDASRDALELCIYMGGQRSTQLLRLRRQDVNLSARTIPIGDYG